MIKSEVKDIVKIGDTVRVKTRFYKHSITGKLLKICKLHILIERHIDDIEAVNYVSLEWIRQENK